MLVATRGNLNGEKYYNGGEGIMKIGCCFFNEVAPYGEVFRGGGGDKKLHARYCILD